MEVVGAGDGGQGDQGGALGGGRLRGEGTRQRHGGEVRVGHREVLGSEILTLKSRTLPFLFHTM